MELWERMGCEELNCGSGIDGNGQRTSTYMMGWMAPLLWSKEVWTWTYNMKRPINYWICFLCFMLTVWIHNPGKWTRQRQEIRAAWQRQQSCGGKETIFSLWRICLFLKRTTFGWCLSKEDLWSPNFRSINHELNSMATDLFYSMSSLKIGMGKSKEIM